MILKQNEISGVTFMTALKKWLRNFCHRAMLVILTALLIVSAVVFTSCGSITDDEAKDIIRELLPKTYELNDILFGPGLPYEKVPGGTDALLYLPVTKEAPYQNEKELKEATLLVFSPDYAESIFNLIFSGYSIGESESKSDSKGVIFARYFDGDDGILRVNVNFEPIVKKSRTYDLNTIEIISKSNRRIIAKVGSIIDGKADVTVKITFVNTDNGWRVDSATY